MTTTSRSLTTGGTPFPCPLLCPFLMHGHLLILCIFFTAVADDFQTDDSNDSKADSIELDQDSDSLDSEKVLNLAFMEQENNDPGKMRSPGALSHPHSSPSHRSISPI